MELFHSYDDQLDFGRQVDEEVEKSKRTWRELLSATGFEIKNMWQLVNPYWPRSYPDMVMKNPWWLVETQYGMIEVGPRKRVYVIDWTKTGVEIDNFLTGDDESVTHGKTYTHAWNREKVLMYLLKLHKELESQCMKLS